MTEHDFDHLPDASFPIAAAARVHRPPRAGRRAGRAVEGRRGRRSTPRSIRDDAEARRVIAGDRGRDRPADRRPGPLRGRPAVGRDPRAASTRCPGSTPRVTPDRSAHEVLHLGAARPVPHRPHGPRHGRRASRRVVVELRDDRLPGARRGGRGLSRTGSTARRPRRWPSSCPMLLRGRRGVRADRRRAAARPTAAMDGAIRGHGAAKCAIDIALHDLVGKVPGVPVHDAARPVGRRSRRPTSPSASTSRPIVAERARAGGATSRRSRSRCGGPGDLATLEAVRAVFDGPIRVDANTGWTPEDAGRPAARPRAPRRRAHRAAVPGRAGSTSCAGSRSARRCRSSPTRAASCPRTSTASSASSPASTSSSPSAAGSGRPRRMLDARPRARLPDVPRLHGGDVGRDRRIGGRRVAGRLGRPRRLPAARRRPVRRPRPRRRTTAGILSDRPGLGLTRAGGAEPAHARTARAFAERPFVWITWWTKWWTSPLPARRPQAYDGPAPAAETPREWRPADTGRPTSGGRIDHADPVGPSFVLPPPAGRQPAPEAA